MKKEYLSPELELTKFSFRDVLNSAVTDSTSSIDDEDRLESEGSGLD